MSDKSHFPSPLTQLTEEERMFYATVRQFAQETIAPAVRTMDDEQQFAPGLVNKLFELGLMGIEIPEALGGAGGSFFDAVLAIEAIATVDPAVAVLVDVHNTLVVNAIRRWANEEQKQKWLPKLAAGYRERLCAERGWFRFGCVCAADARSRRWTAAIG